MIKSILKVLSGDIVARGIGFIVLGIVAANLSVEDFGRYNYILTLLGLTTIITEPLANTYLRDYRFYGYKKYNFSIILLPLILILPFGCIVKYGINDIKWIVIIVYCVSFILIAFLKSYLNANEHYGKYSLVLLSKQVTILLSTIVVLKLINAKDVDVLIVNNFSLALVVIIATFLLFIDRQKVEFAPIKSEFIQLLSDSKYLILYWSIIPLISFIDLFFVENYLSEIELGVYSFSLKLFTISLAGLSPMLTVLRINQIDIARKGIVIGYIKKYIKKVILGSVIVFVVMIITSYILITYLYPEYSESQTSSAILFLCTVISYSTVPFSFLMALRRYKAILMLSVVALAVNILINYFFIEKYGVIAAAISTLLGYSVLNIGNLVLTLRVKSRNTV